MNGPLLNISLSAGCHLYTIPIYATLFYSFISLFFSFLFYDLKVYSTTGVTLWNWHEIKNELKTMM